MSSEAVKAKGGAEKNTINEDAIFRQLVKYENDWARNWPRKWGFMAATPKPGSADARHKAEPKSRYSSGLPTQSDYLVDEGTYKFANVSTDISKINDEQKKSFYLMTHQTKQLQLLAGSPIDKYSFPATRGQEIGWWLTKEKKSMEAGNGADVPPNVSIDAKIGRWARGQGNVYKWYGGGPM